MFLNWYRESFRQVFSNKGRSTYPVGGGRGGDRGAGVKAGGVRFVASCMYKLGIYMECRGNLV